MRSLVVELVAVEEVQGEGREGAVSLRSAAIQMVGFFSFSAINSPSRIHLTMPNSATHSATPRCARTSQRYLLELCTNEQDEPNLCTRLDDCQF
jgi:hypothetical protein